MHMSRVISVVQFAASASAAFLLGLAPVVAQQRSVPPPPGADPAVKPKISTNYGRIPLNFEANRGQTDPSVQFLSHCQRYILFLSQNESVLALHGIKPSSPKITSSADARDAKAMQLDETQASFVRMKLIGSNSHPSVRAEDQQTTKTNYFIGNDPAKWRRDIPNFGRIRYSGVYPGIDLVYYGTQRQLEHDFVVAPGADAGRIAVAIEGAAQLRIDSASGDLILIVGTGASQAELRLLKPVTYQEANGRRTPIPSKYKILTNNSVTFTLGRYNHTRPLVIDPVLVYSTYLGGSGNANGKGDQGNGIAIDSSGDAYIVGTTYSIDFPVTPEAHQGQNLSALAGNGGTVFVAELNPAGTALVYSTFLGGSGGDFGYGIALDSSDNAYVTGATYSTDFPVTCGAFQTTNPTTTTGASTGFVAKLNSTGNGLAYSTYLGGEGNMASPANGDVAQAISVNPSGDAYLSGYTWSANFPITDGVFQPSFAGSVTASNAFVTELNSTGTGLVYSTFLGGSGTNGAGDYGNAIALDANGDAYVAGSTASSNFPVTNGVVQSAFHDSPTGFVTELNPIGTNEVYSTYLGGSNGDSVEAIAVDSAGFAYVAGNTDSSDFPLTPGTLEGAGSAIIPYVSQYGPFGFVAKLNPGASTLEYSSFMEGHGTTISGIAVDGTGAVYLTGAAATLGAASFGGFQPTPDALAIPASQGNSAFLVKLDPAGTMLNFATLLGGSGNENAAAMALDSAGNAYLTGSAESSNFPTTAGAFQTANNGVKSGASNAFMSKLELSAESNQTGYPSLPSNVPTTLTETESGGWDIYCDETYDSISVTLSSPVGGPPPTGAIYWLANVEYPYETFVGGSWGGTWNVQLDLGSISGGSIDWQAEYSGDAIYQGSSTGGEFNPGLCPYGGSGQQRLHGQTGEARTPAHVAGPEDRAGVRVGLKELTANTTQVPTPAEGGIQSPKFTPERAATSNENRPLSRASSAQACTAPLTPLTVTVLPANATRVYGAANPIFTYTISGLLDGDSVSVAALPPGPTAPVGNHAVSASVSGVAAANYAVNVITSTLTITPAPLILSAPSYSSTYGQMPPPPQYQFTGFLNGDTARVVTGAPVISVAETLAPTTLPGEYPIQISVGTLMAENYTISTSGAAPGYVVVDKAPLSIIPHDSYQLAGIAPGDFFYDITGFVNGQDASVVSGKPILTTTVKSPFPAGIYPINSTIGTLKSANYDFAFEQGFLNVFAPFDVDGGLIQIGSIVGSFDYLDIGQGPESTLGSAIELTEGSPRGGFQFEKAPFDQEYGYIEFIPHEPGLWIGELQLLNNSTPAEPLISVPISANVVAPQLVFDPGVIAGISPHGSAALDSPQGVAVDESGTLYIVDTGADRVVKEVENTGTLVSLDGVKLKSPSAIAIDGGGNLYIADTDNNRVVQLTIAGKAHVQSLDKLTLSAPRGLVVDASGDLLIADTGHNRIVKVMANGLVSLVSTGEIKLSSPAGLAVDDAGDLFIADNGNNRIIKINSKGAASVVNTGTPGLSSPTGVAVDPAGSLYITQENRGTLIEVSPVGVQTMLLTDGLSNPHGIALDHIGTVYVTDTGNKRVFEVLRADGPGLSFASTPQGKLSAGGPQIVTVRNIGNAALTVSDVIYPADFPEDTSGKSKDCKYGQTLAASASCTLTIEFKPVTPLTKGTSAALKESVTITSNSLNAQGAVQTVVVKGTELK